MYHNLEVNNSHHSHNDRPKSQDVTKQHYSAGPVLGVTKGKHLGVMCVGSVFFSVLQCHDTLIPKELRDWTRMSGKLNADVFAWSFG